MSAVQSLIEKIREVRNNYLSTISSVSEVQSKWKPDEQCWNITDITEHLFWAELYGTNGMWSALHATRNNLANWEGEEIHKGLPIETIIEKTWKDKENVPAGAGPQLGGPIIYWRTAFQNLQDQLDLFGKDLQDDELEMRAQPHPISGPLNMRQRLEFLRFHINRHQQQAEKLIEKMK